jgi:DNA-directed RNA polymerase subunit K/omega
LKNRFQKLNIIQTGILKPEVDMRKDNMDVVSLPVEFDGNKFDSTYRLVIAVIKRAKALHQGALPKISTKSRKVSTVALEEAVSGSLHVLTGKAAVEAEKVVGKLSYEKMIDEAKQKESLPEDKSELEKELEDYLHQKQKADTEIVKY